MTDSPKPRRWGLSLRALWILPMCIAAIGFALGHHRASQEEEAAIRYLEWWASELPREPMPQRESVFAPACTCAPRSDEVIAGLCCEPVCSRCTATCSRCPAKERIIITAAQPAGYEFSTKSGCHEWSAVASPKGGTWWFRRRSFRLDDSGTIKAIGAEHAGGR